ncbi:hypothetical protein [Planctomicrobium sp. SH527]|uniref:hypothetical protein n=1 Tax=Planctomicrobium sp. SH527 TaxID=3448123 RepID=UPI003F5CB2FE
MARRPSATVTSPDCPEEAESDDLSGHEYPGARMPAPQAGGFYQQRWKIEVLFRSLKQT